MIGEIAGSLSLASNIPATRLMSLQQANYLGADYTVLITDKYLQVVGDPLSHWTSLQATLRWKEPGSGQIVTPAHQYVREQIAPGNRIVILRTVWGQTSTLISGPIEEVLRERSDDGDNGGVGVMTITFADDMSWLGARLTYPDPTVIARKQQVDYWTFIGDPAEAMYKLVDLNAGPGALPQRRVPGLKTAKNTAIYPAGTTVVSVKTRLEKLTDVLRAICTKSVGLPGRYDPDSLGFTVIQQGNQIVFEVRRSRDLSGQVLFGFNVGNLQYYAFDQTAPEVTHPHVGGQGTGSNAFFDEFPSTDEDNLAWGRFETYEAMPGSSTRPEMKAQAATALAEHGQSARLASNASDTPDQRFGVHYNIGDVVSIELQSGSYVSGPVQTINVQAYPTAGEVVGVTIGSQAARYDSSYVRLLRQLSARVGDLERITVPNNTTGSSS